MKSSSIEEVWGGALGSIRPVRIDDAESLFTTELAIVEAGIGVVQDLEDLPKDIDEYRQNLAEKQDDLDGTGILLVGVLANEVVGYLQIEQLAPTRIRHVAKLSVGVHPTHQGLGIGKSLLRSGLLWSTNLSNPSIRRVELGVDATNIRARNLYSAFGFVVEGRRQGFHKAPSGEYIDDIIMALNFHELSQSQTLI